MRLRVAADVFGSPGRRLEIARGARAFGGTVNTHSGVVSALSAAGALRVFSELLAMGGWQGRVPSRVGPEGQRGACRCVRVAGGEQAGRLPRASAHVIQRAVARHSHGQRAPTLNAPVAVRSTRSRAYPPGLVAGSGGVVKAHPGGVNAGRPIGLFVLFFSAKQSAGSLQRWSTTTSKHTRPPAFDLGEPSWVGVPGKARSPR